MSSTAVQDSQVSGREAAPMLQGEREHGGIDDHAEWGGTVDRPAPQPERTRALHLDWPDGELSRSRPPPST